MKYIVAALFVFSAHSAFAYITAQPGAVFFPATKIGMASARTVLVQNNSDKPENIRVMGACWGGIDVHSSCFGTLQKYQSCSVNIWFRPTREGNVSCSLSVYGSSNGTSVSISGYGIK